MKNRRILTALCAATLLLAGCAKAPESAKSAADSAAGAEAAGAKPAAAASAGAYLPDPNRKYPERVLWGDEHVHTGWSADAGLFGATLTPEDTVRFVRGEEVKSSTGRPTKLHRPFDWVAVTDHSDGMGTINELRVKNAEMMADPIAKGWAEAIASGDPAKGALAAREVISRQATKSLPKIMMDPKWLVSAWEKTVDVMEKYNEPGKFTAFIAYEWTSNGERGENLHRNVIFRDGGDKTRGFMPLTTFQSAVPGREGTDPESLWKWLSDYEEKSGGRVLAIPHNANLSNGWMFREARYDGSPMTAGWASARARWEPVYEVYQYKGLTEAHPMMSPTDEFANFGIWDKSDLNGNPKPAGAVKFEYIREALKEGMRLQDQLGTNPFKYGMAAGTDTHTGLPTGGEEDNFGGKFVQMEHGVKDRWDEVFAKRKDGTIQKDWTVMCAGVMGVWATANTREAIWDAMMRRETYASTGPRITVRFFGGYGFSDADAAAGKLVVTGYEKGVPMGGDLKPAAGQAPTFLFAAMKDPMGGNLDRVQIIKGWVSQDGKTHEKVYDVKWGGDRKPGADGKLPPVGNTVDTKAATYANSIGASELSGSFTDPEFNAKDKAFYYARVIEIPTPTWMDYDHAQFQADPSAEVPLTQQERAVTSPIWYNPH
jgi:hypothetical protein